MILKKKQKHRYTYLCSRFIKEIQDATFTSKKMVICNWKLFCIPPSTVALYKSGLILIIIVLPTAQAYY